MVEIEAAPEWRWVARELQARGTELRPCAPAQARALQGNRTRPGLTGSMPAGWSCSGR